MSVPKRRKLSPAVARERKRCARLAREAAVFAYVYYPEDSGQWVRCEKIMITIDPTAKRIGEYDGPQKWPKDRRRP